MPALTIAAWYDIFQGGSLRNYVGLRDHAGNEEARKQQRLIVTHRRARGHGREDWRSGLWARAATYDENALTLEWYEYLFQGKQNQFASDKPVRIFVMGANTWAR